MKTVVVTLKSMAPYSQGKHFEKELKPGETERMHEERRWRERMHINSEGSVFIPPMAFKNCLSEAAKFLGMKIPGKRNFTFTKHFEAGVHIVDPVTLPVRGEDVKGQWQYVPSDGVRGSGKRVDKCFPVIPEWRGDVTIHVLDETVLAVIDTPEGKMTALEWHLRQAGAFVGIGVFRPKNNGFFGRFAVEKIKGL